MFCLRHLIHCFIEKLYPDAPLLSFVEFYASKLPRPKDVLALILSNPEYWHKFISPVVIAGTRLEFEYFLQKALQLKDHECIEIRRRIIFALGMIDYLDNK